MSRSLLNGGVGDQLFAGGCENLADRAKSSFRDPPLQSTGAFDRVIELAQEIIWRGGGRAFLLCERQQRSGQAFVQLGERFG